MKNKHSRRDFLKVTTAGAFGAFAVSRYATSSGPVFSHPAADLKSFGIALQLYTIRDAMATDVAGSLKKVSDTGYKYLELANYADRKFYGMEPEEFKKLVNGLGMEILSSHAGIEPKDFTPDLAKVTAEDHARVGAKYCMQPFVAEEDRKTLDSYRKLVANWNTTGAIMKESGIQYGYHNHNFEFATLEGKVPYFDILLAGLDKDLVTMEIDLFWAIKAGQNPVEIFKKYPGRFQLFHLKDMFTSQPPVFSTSGASDFAPVGAGIVDFKKILAAKKIAGMKYMIVEQDKSREGKPFDDIKTSIINLTTKILV